MIFNGFAHPEQLTVLTKVLDGYCRNHKIASNSPERADAGRMVMSLFERGRHTSKELSAALSVVNGRAPLQS